MPHALTESNPVRRRPPRRSAPWLLRGVTYVAALYAIELVASVLLVRLTGAYVWRWVGRGSVGGHVHLAMAPMWLGLALALEPVHDLLMRPPGV
jgi:hypothetical protein